jgi:hypothetical protein
MSGELKEDSDEEVLDKWGLNSVSFVWAKYGYAEHALWLIYGNFSMKMPEIAFVEEAKLQLILKGNSEGYDVNIVSVAEIVKKMGDGTFACVFYMGKNYLFPGGFFQRTLRMQAEFAVTDEKSAVQNAGIINKYSAEAIYVGDNGKVNRGGNDSQLAISGGNVSQNQKNVNVMIFLAIVAVAVATTTVEIPIHEVNGLKIAETCILGVLSQLPNAIYKMWRGK